MQSGPLLARTYRSVLELANQHKLRTVALPAISCGVFGFPVAEAADVRLGGALALGWGGEAESGERVLRAQAWA